METGDKLTEAGIHPFTGGNGMLVYSDDMLLEALVVCSGVTLSVVVTANGIENTDAIVYAEGDIYFRSTLGVSKETEVGFKAIRLSFMLNTDATPEQIQSLTKLTESYCGVYQNLKNVVQ